MAVASDRVNATLKAFTRWAREAPQKLSGDPDADADELRLLLGLLRDHIGVDYPADLGPGDLSELLLLVYPRKVTALDAGATASTVPALRDLLAFLADTGALGPTAANRLGRELDEVAPRLADAVVNPKNWADDDLEDFDLEDDFDLDDDDFSLKEAFGLPDRLPPVRLPPEPELAAMSRAAPLLGRARGLADWLAPGRDITEQLELTVQDTIAAAHELGIPVPVKADAGPEPLSAISPPDQARDEDVEDRPVARLTPLGGWAMRELLLEDDVEIPLFPSPDQMTAPDLLAAMEGLGEEEFKAEMAAWLELRSPDVAAGELLAAAAVGGPAERLLAVAATQTLGAAAEPAWRDALARPELRPYAKFALTEIAGGEPGVTVLPGLEPEPADIAWMLIDTLAVMSGDPGKLPQQIRDAIPVGQEQHAFDAISLSPHPDAAAALTLIGKHHPDKQIAKAARRSAYRASSRPKHLS